MNQRNESQEDCLKLDILGSTRTHSLITDMLQTAMQHMCQCSDSLCACTFITTAISFQFVGLSPLSAGDLRHAVCWVLLIKQTTAYLNIEQQALQRLHSEGGWRRHMRQHSALLWQQWDWDNLRSKLQGDGSSVFYFKLRLVSDTDYSNMLSLIKWEESSQQFVNEKHFGRIDELKLMKTWFTAECCCERPSEGTRREPPVTSVLHVSPISTCLYGIHPYVQNICPTVANQRHKQYIIQSIYIYIKTSPLTLLNIHYVHDVLQSVCLNKEPSRCT